MKLVPFNEDYVNCNIQNLTGGTIITVLMQFMEQKRRQKIKSPELQ